MEFRIAQVASNAVHQLLRLFRGPVEDSSEDGEGVGFDGLEHLVELESTQFFQLFVFGPRSHRHLHRFIREKCCEWPRQ